MRKAEEKTERRGVGRRAKFNRKQERRKMGKMGKKEGEGGVENEEGGGKMERRRRREERGKGLGWGEARWKRKRWRGEELQEKNNRD
jgi:hypothetical protein